MLGGAYSTQYKTVERQHVDTIKTLAENEKTDALARARKMSVETNRRRRALAIKRKAEAEREEKRRQQILAKRREKQQEATEKFQRSHIPNSRPNSGSSSGKWSPRRHNTQLDDALKLIRSSPSSSRATSAKSRQVTSPSSSYYRQNSDPLSKPYFNKYAHPTINNGNTVSAQNKQEELHNKSLRNLNNSRNLFEQQLENYQQTLYDQQQKTIQDFNKQVMQEMAIDKNMVNYEHNDTGDIERTESLSSVDSLEDGGSNDTLRESCDLDAYMVHKNNANSNNNVLNNTKHVTIATDSVSSTREGGKINGNISHVVYNGMDTGPQNIDSYNTQMHTLLGQNSSAVGAAQTTDAQRQQHYLQRQREIQQQLQEQRQQQLILQQKQQKELQQKVIEQQQKQQQLLQQQYERQKQQEAAEQQRLAQEQQQQALAANQAAGAYTVTHDDDSKENQRPKLKAWGTPSPHPPVPVTSPASTHVTHTSPYSGKNTHTNMTIPYVNSNNQQSMIPESPSSVSSKLNVPHNGSSVTPSRTLDRNLQAVANANASYYLSEQPSMQLNNDETTGKNMSFLETVTDGLPASQTSGTTAPVSTMSSAGVKTTSSSSSVNSTKVTQQSVVKATTASPNVKNGVTTTTTNSATSTPKPPIHPGYYNSYGAAYSARQQLMNTGNGSNNKQTDNDITNKTSVTSESSKTSTDVTNASSGVTKTTTSVKWVVDNSSIPSSIKMLTPDTTMINGDDITDTDSVSTICGEEKEPEPKEIKGILKRTGNNKKTVSILKKSGSTGNMKDIRDSLEITRVHLINGSEEKEIKPTKKNVRWTDLTYDDDDNDDDNGSRDDKVFVKRTNDTLHQKPPRPVSAVTLKSNNQKVDSRPARAVSATVRTSTIPRAKTQIVRPQAQAHIITQSGQNIDPISANDKVTIVNSNFMEKVPSMVRANQGVGTAAPSSVYNVNSVHGTQPQQKVNYAVSSIVMPKSESAPFMYPGYNKHGLVPTGSDDGPSQPGTSSKYDSGAVYNENGVRIDRTPTDEEINFLWDKLRNCLSRNSTATPDKGQQDTGGPRQAAPVSHTYIDGNALGQFNSLNRVAQPQNTNPAVRRQNSMDNAATGSYTRRYGLLQQRKQQVNPNSLKSRQQQQSYTVYQPPVPSHNDPQPSNLVQNGNDVSESLAGFLAAEQLMEQSVSDSRVHQAIDDAQARQFAYNTSRPQPKVKSALSIEEQRLMESLDRLNDKLKATEETVPIHNPANQPAPVPHATPSQRVTSQQTVTHEKQDNSSNESVGGFKGHTPLSQRRVIETGNNNRKLRITSASLKRNIHRHQ
ncbi:hypothetical protein ACF0H5_008234 [Mactra antiquata]